MFKKDSLTVEMFLKALQSQRAIYFGLAICHGVGCFTTTTPEFYGVLAALYGLMAYR